MTKNEKVIIKKMKQDYEAKMLRRIASYEKRLENQMINNSELFDKKIELESLREEARTLREKIKEVKAEIKALREEKSSK